MHDKRHLRSAISARRDARDPAEVTAAGRALAALAPVAAARADLVACFVGVGNEPPTLPLIDGLVGLGVRVLLPVVSGADLDWVEYDGAATLTRSSLGLLEPAGQQLGPAAVRGCGLALVPALAVDRQGRRLGRGGGYFDRALALRPVASVFAVVYDDELLDEVPVEDHDVPVDGAFTPSGVVTF